MTDAAQRQQNTAATQALAGLLGLTVAGLEFLWRAQRARGLTRAGDAVSWVSEHLQLMGARAGFPPMAAAKTQPGAAVLQQTQPGAAVLQQTQPGAAVLQAPQPRPGLPALARRVIRPAGAESGPDGVAGEPGRERKARRHEGTQARREPG